MKVLRRWKDDQGLTRVQYEASFWEGPTEPGQIGRRVTRKCGTVFVNGRPLNEAPSVSYYGQLLKLA